MQLLATQTQQSPASTAPSSWQLPMSYSDTLIDLGAAAYGSGNFQAARAAWEQLPDNDRHSVDTVVGPGFFLEKSVSINR
jgi:hypothetical protein